MKQTTPKHIGFEIELGGHLLATDSEHPARDAAEALVAAHHRLYGQHDDDRLDRSDEFDGHGFRVYRDHEHCEVASSLQSSATLLTLALRDVRSVMAACQREAEKQVGPMRVSFNCTSRQGTAWGFHANFLVARSAFDTWRDADWTPLMKQWVPFAVTSLPIIGAGKAGAENGASDCMYQYSQRSDFVSECIALETVVKKSIVNSRDEPLADPARFARLHVAAPWDTNLVEPANWLKFGVSQVLLALIEEDVPMPDLALKDPIRALHQVSRDLKLRRRLPLRGGGYNTALGIQRRLAEAATAHLEAGCAASAVPDARLITEKWIEALDDLEARRSRLIRRLDWCAKLDVLRRAGDAGRLDRESPLALDLQFAEIGGIFERLERAGAVDSLEDLLPPSALAGAATQLVPREQARAILVNRFGRHLADVDWDRVVGRDETGQLWLIPMDDPLGGQCLLRIVNGAENWTACLGALVGTMLATRVVEVCAVAYESDATDAVYVEVGDESS